MTVLPARHCPEPLQVSDPLQRSASAQLVPAATGTWATPPAGSQESAVHGFPSSTTGGTPATQVPEVHVSAPLHTVASAHELPSGFAGFEQTPVEASQVPARWQASEATQTTGLPPEQAPAWHVSVCVQALPSLQALPFAFGGFEQTPVAVLQVPASWHWSDAVQITGFAPEQVPDWQMSVCVQAFESLQAAPFALAGFEQRPVLGLQVPTSWH